MSRQGIRRAIGFIAAAHRSYSSCTQYRENIAEARAHLARAGLPDVEVTYVDGTRVLRITRASLEELNQTQPQLALQLTLNLARILCGKLVNVHARAFRLPG